MPGSVSTVACLQRAWQFAPSVCRAGLDRKISPNRNRRPNHNPPRCTSALGLQLDEQIDWVENRNCDWKKGRLIFAGSIQRMAEPNCFAAFLRTLFRQDWVVYAKPAFGGPEKVLRYLGRYTHRIAISNQRLVSFDGCN